MSHPKFILVSDPATPLVGTFVYGMVDQHRDLVRGYVKVPRLSFLNRIPRELEGYTFIFSPGWNLPGNVLDLSEVEWF